ncbi:MAG: DUF2277 domain-containing protein [Candidatus Sumerlaeaceae bacterium]|nr:DUF2277 domain-containing protein [Candidatus Sumerlaeaceae bacterium]
MCRNIKPLFNFEPPVTESEVRDAGLQFVRKISGFRAPSRANAAAFERAVDEISAASMRLLESLKPAGEPRNRAEEEAKLRARSIQRFGGK